MEITASTVRQLEALAALRLSDAERERMRSQLERILGYMQQLSELDLRDVPPTSHGLEAQNVLREDQVQPSLPTEDVLRNAPDARGDFFRVPRFLGEGEERE
jgi:aspartyl-tRNA(Asn)/glutamyl-tRNA(Gln) amidotransferase subunit C